MGTLSSRAFQKLTSAGILLLSLLIGTTPHLGYAGQYSKIKLGNRILALKATDYQKLSDELWAKMIEEWHQEQLD